MSSSSFVVAMVGALIILAAADVFLHPIFQVWYVVNTFGWSASTVAAWYIGPYVVLVALIYRALGN